MLKSDLHPPLDGPNADPVLYGVAAGLARLFPPVESPMPRPARDEHRDDGGADAPGERRER
ncbi:hypothetical protein [Methylobacterium sp. J-067]|uniref:hypothetical protein n=1 Tax=Methylobacterium sp. J-067 TaxID=2836648 RepID=UPI001FBBEFC3|nr:hypothetical protein [Methylobacterium sp. J-067]MCJ2027579.1 hypothetical protein [Methylobacterium sp. J-067]